MQAGDPIRPLGPVRLGPEEIRSPQEWPITARRDQYKAENVMAIYHLATPYLFPCSNYALVR
jgi:hypothetical protein